MLPGVSETTQTRPVWALEPTQRAITPPGVQSTESRVNAFSTASKGIERPVPSLVRQVPGMFAIAPVVVAILARPAQVIPPLPWIDADAVSPPRRTPLLCTEP